MAVTPSTMLPLGTAAPHFSLPDCRGGTVSLEDFSSKPALLVAFWANHCPYVRHVREYFASLAREHQARGAAIVAICSNDFETYPQDGPEGMAEEAKTLGYTFPYLVDADQKVARAYRAACTPDFFLFDAGRRLVYRGQMDDSRPGNGKPLTGADLRAALDAVLAGKPVSGVQKPSIGCNIKWKLGNEPDYFGRAG
jgi:peroxiredoxin